MAELGRYCKAYRLSQFQDYKMWEDLKIRSSASRDEALPDTSKEDVVVYLQENYVLTRDMYLDSDVVFDAVDDDWKKYCNQVLGFDVPGFIFEAERLVEKDWEEFQKKDSDTSETNA